MTKYICTRCSREFKDSSGLTKHITLKKVRCDGIIDTDYWLRKNIAKINERYKYLKMVSELPEEGEYSMEFEMKNKILKAFYLKACNILKIIEEMLLNNKEAIPSITEEDAHKIKNYIECCKTGIYN